MTSLPQKLNEAKKNELERLAFFSGKDHFTDDEINSYFEWSENGIGNGGRLSIFKQRIGITLRMWEDSFSDGTWLGYYHLVRDEDGKRIPKHIVDFIKKEMFKGKDSEIIENAYSQN